MAKKTILNVRSALARKQLSGVVREAVKDIFAKVAKTRFPLTTAQKTRRSGFIMSTGLHLGSSATNRATARASRYI
jgi:hypothetical protein